MEIWFLGMLRPYTGLIEENFIEIMECLKCLQEEFYNNFMLKELIANMYGIVYYTNLWTDKGGMLENVLNNDEKGKLREWINIISYCLLCLIEGSDEAFLEYEEYLKEHNYII